jgi:hypothetical protein
LVGQFTPRHAICTIVCKFYVASHLCVNTYPCQMYYVIHKLQSLLRATIHLNMHEHPVCHNLNIGFTMKCEVQGPMRRKKCVYVWNTFSQMGESARDEA